MSTKYTSEFEHAAKRMTLDQLKDGFRATDATMSGHTPPRMAQYEYERAETVDVMLWRQAYAIEIARRISK